MSDDFVVVNDAQFMYPHKVSYEPVIIRPPSPTAKTEEERCRYQNLSHKFKVHYSKQEKWFKKTIVQEIRDELNAEIIKSIQVLAKKP